MKSIEKIFAIQLESGNMGYSLNTSGKFFTTFNIVHFLHLPILLQGLPEFMKSLAIKSKGRK